MNNEGAIQTIKANYPPEKCTRKREALVTL